jgi:hypothetical protein
MRRGGSDGDRRRRVMVMESEANGGGVGDLWAATSGKWVGIAVGSCAAVGGNFILLMWLWACAVLVGPVEPKSKRPHES